MTNSSALFGMLILVKLFWTSITKKKINQIKIYIYPKLKLFKMKKTEFPLQKYFKVVIYPSEVGWKQVWNDADASWEMICCKAFLRAGEPQPLPRAKAGGWDIAGRDEPELVLSQEKEEGRGKAEEVLFGHKCGTSWANQSIFLEPFLLVFSLLMVIISNTVSTKARI